MVFIQEMKLRKIKDALYIINLDEFKSVGTHCIVLYVNGNNRRVSCDAIYFNSFGVENIPKVFQLKMKICQTIC